MTANGRLALASRSTAVSLVALILAGCSTGGGTVQGDERVSVSGIEVTVPATWSYGDTGEGMLVVANRASDIDAEVPSGPRLTVSATGADLPDPTELFATSREEEATIRGEPERVTVDGEPAVAIETAGVRGGTPIVSRVLVVGGELGSGYTLTEEAPEDQWDSARAELDEIVSSLRFGGSGKGAMLLLLVVLTGLGISGGAIWIVLARRRGRTPVAAEAAGGSPSAEAGWYADPAGEARLRYWDGSEWTRDTAD